MGGYRGGGAGEVSNNKLLRGQIEAILESLPYGESGAANTHWRIGVSINAIRDALAKDAPPQHKAMFDTILRPLEIRESGGPYTLETQNAKALCRQLLAYVTAEDSY
jgi:hypothetical protein